MMPMGRINLLPSGNSIGIPLGTFKILHKCSHTTRWIMNPFILQRLIFDLLKFHPLKFFFELLLDRRMGHCEWMAWMWSTHEATPSIHSALVAWMDDGHQIAWFILTHWYLDRVGNRPSFIIAAECQTGNFSPPENASTGLNRFVMSSSTLLPCTLPSLTWYEH